MSVTEDGTIKFNLDMCFTDYKTLYPGGPTMSVTPTEPNHFTWTVDNFPKAFKEKAAQAMAGLYGDSAKAAKIESYRMCWCVFIVFCATPELLIVYFAGIRQHLGTIS
jgi:sarcosine oxidase / L-pipecolate oxidase